MTGESQPSERQELEARRNKESSRQLTLGRRVLYFFGYYALRFVAALLWSTYRVHKVIGQETIDDISRDGRAYAPCYWHKHLLVGNFMVRDWMRQKFRACFIISASVDGDVPARIARAWGAEVIRGSASRAGTLVLRDLHKKIQRGVSVVTTPDGPTGPIFKFKSGIVLMAKIAGTPVVPVACAADRAWYLRKRWDKFMIPKPFARLVLAVGQPIRIPSGTPMDELEAYRVEMEDAVNRLVMSPTPCLRPKREAKWSLAF